MNDFKKMLIDTLGFKISLGVISLLSLISIIFNVSELSFILFLYVPFSFIYCNMYTKNILTSSDHKMIILNTVIYVLAYPSILLYKFACFVIKTIIYIAKLTTPNFKIPKKFKKRKW